MEHPARTILESFSGSLIEDAPFRLERPEDVNLIRGVMNLFLGEMYLETCRTPLPEAAGKKMIDRACAREANRLIGFLEETRHPGGEEEIETLHTRAKDLYEISLGSQEPETGFSRRASQARDEALFRHQAHPAKEPDLETNLTLWERGEKQVFPRHEIAARHKELEASLSKTKKRREGEEHRQAMRLSHATWRQYRRTGFFLATEIAKARHPFLPAELEATKEAMQECFREGRLFSAHRMETALETIFEKARNQASLQEGLQIDVRLLGKKPHLQEPLWRQTLILETSARSLTPAH